MEPERKLLDILNQSQLFDNLDAKVLPLKLLSPILTNIQKSSGDPNGEQNEIISKSEFDEFLQNKNLFEDDDVRMLCSQIIGGLNTFRKDEQDEVIQSLLNIKDTYLFTITQQLFTKIVSILSERGETIDEILEDYTKQLATITKLNKNDLVKVNLDYQKEMETLFRTNHKIVSKSANTLEQICHQTLCLPAIIRPALMNSFMNIANKPHLIKPVKRRRRNHRLRTAVARWLINL